MKRTPEEQAAFLEAHRIRMIQSPTAAEARLWEQLEPLGFEFQRPLLAQGRWLQTYPYILDFFHAGASLCVEVDGSAHRMRRGHDRWRDNRLAAMGIKTIRVSNRDVIHRLARVMDAIQRAMEEAKWT